VIREIILDTETTGLSPQGGDRLVEIGCLELINHLPTGRQYHQYINPEREVPEEAVRVHGLTYERLKPEPVFAQVADAFLDFVQDSPLVIHNASFDMGFINHELGKLGRPPIPMARAVDTVQIARRKFPGAPASLDALCRRFGIDNSGRTFHGALLDASLLADVYIELLGGRQVGLTFERTSVSRGGVTVKTETLTVREARPHAPSEDELSAHAAFIKKMKTPAIWLQE
jgi:DNA polymerase-3 subunit epsilon